MQISLTRTQSSSVLTFELYAQSLVFILRSILSVLILCLCTTIARSAQMYYSNTYKFILSHTHTDCFKSSVHSKNKTMSHSSLHANMHDIHSCSCAASCGNPVCYICVSPSPTLNPCGNILNAQKYKTLIWTGKRGNMAFQRRGKGLVTMFLKLVPGNHSMFTEASLLSLSSSSK